MALVRDKDGKRLHVKSRLMGKSLVSKEFLNKLKVAPQRLYPDVAVMKIGGQSICDRGASAPEESYLLKMKTGFILMIPNKILMLNLFQRSVLSN